MDNPASPIDCDADARKRVCKACDRCRIKKSKCDGKKPCSRCRNDDAICVFGGRKKKTDRVHPKGYVEILERQQKQLVKGIRAIYDLQIGGHTWGGPLPHNGYPPTHVILEHLGALDVDDSSDDDEREDIYQFEEDIRRLRKSVGDRNDTMQSDAPRLVAATITKQQKLRPVQSSKEYFDSARLSEGTNGTPPSRSPDSLTTSQTSPATSLDSQHWSTSIWLDQKPSHWLEKGSISMGELTKRNENEFVDSPMQDGFDDPFLIAPWDPDEDLSSLVYD